MKRKDKTIAEMFPDQAKRDPIDELFTGIQFRNGGKQEAIRRIHDFIGNQLSITIKGERERTHALLMEKDQVIGHLNQRIHRLNRSIRTLNEQHAEALIEAVVANEPPIMGIASEGNKLSRKSYAEVAHEEECRA